MYILNKNSKSNSSQKYDPVVKREISETLELEEGSQTSTIDQRFNGISVTHSPSRDKIFKESKNNSEIFLRRRRTSSSRRSNIRQEDVEEVEIRSMEGFPRRRNRHRQRNHLESLDEFTIKLRPQPTIHFSGDTSRYVLGQHTNFNGDGHLRHPDQTYVDWKPSDWVKPLKMEDKFELVNGYLKIKEYGLYLVYAQIYYLDEHDTNGYRIHKNREAILQCTVMTHSMSSIIKGNTCYTAGVEYLREGDEISIRDLANGRYSLFEPGKSFFGIIKLGDIKIK